MASSFAFVPRSVKKKPSVLNPDRAVSTNAPSTPKVVGAQVPGGSHGQRNEESAAGKSGQANAPLPEDLAALVCLALSDYALWSDSDLRRRIALGERRGEPEDTDDDGYVALSYLLSHSDVFRTSSTPNAQPLNSLPQTTFAKAVRMHASNFLDVRLVLSPTQASHDVGYEIRRKDWSARPFDSYGKSDWEKLTIYVENIPVQCRTLGAVLSFIRRLLPERTQPIQHILFPRHHRDPPGAVAACKGFALVTLSLGGDVDILLSRWPWKLVSSSTSLDAEKESSNIAIDAQKHGFRTIRKKAWEDLRAEYLLYRQQLIDQINTIQDAQEKPSLPTATASNAKRKYIAEDNNEEVRQDAKPDLPQLYPNSPYPPGCLVFVRNLHPETNKTTLKNLFSKFRPGLDYVDYTKGINSAHLRLKAPHIAQSFVNHYTSHAIAQTSGLDDKGAAPGATDKAIEAVLLRGKPEDIYWGKVPEKIRAEAVKQALQASSADRQGAPTEEVVQGKGKRQRNK